MSNVVPAAPAPSMHEIAERAGVGKATVSLALRDDPRLRPETRRRIQRLASKMGYRTNATVANLMAQLRASRSAKYHATLGILNVSPDPGALDGARADREWVTGCDERAGQLGYALEPLWLHEPGIGPAQLAGTLEARNIRGLVVAGQPEGVAARVVLDGILRRLPMRGSRVLPPSPPLNFAANDHYTTVFHAVLRLRGYGYSRMGLVLSPQADALVERRYSAGFRASLEEIDGGERITVFPFHPGAECAFREWYAEHRPEAIVCIHHEIKEWLENIGMRIPGDIGLAHLEVDDSRPPGQGCIRTTGSSAPPPSTCSSARFTATRPARRRFPKAASSAAHGSMGRPSPHRHGGARPRHAALDRVMA